MRVLTQKRQIVEMLTNDWVWETLTYPAYSSSLRLSLCHFLSPKAKEPICGERFTPVKEINDTWKTSLK